MAYDLLTSPDFRLAFEITPLPMMLASQEGVIITANERFADLFGYTAQELIGQSVDTLVPLSARDAHPRLRGAYFRVPTKRDMGTGRDVHGLRKDGTILPLEIALEPVTSGGETCVMLVAIDISQRKKDQTHMRQALDASASAMVMTDADGLIVMVNKAALSLLGYSARELLGGPVSCLIPDAVKPAHAVYMRNAVSGDLVKGIAKDRQINARHKSGENVPVQVSLTRIETGDGYYIMSTIVDLRQTLEHSRMIESKNEELAKLNEELSQFAYTASHDLKSPLLSVIGLLQLCREDIKDADYAEVNRNLNAALDICNRSAHQVEGVLELARAGRRGVDVTTFDLADLIEKVWLDQTGPDTTAVLTKRIPRGMTVTTERVTLAVILENLMSNALKYSGGLRRKPRILVRAVHAPAEVRITVEDNGVGIKPEHHDKVFEMFNQFDTRGGAGLGLALVKKHVTRLGGHVMVESEAGKGTKMRFVLPKRSREQTKRAG